MSARATTSGVTSSSCWSKSIFGPWLVQLSRTFFKSGFQKRVFCWSKSIHGPWLVQLFRIFWYFLKMDFSKRWFRWMAMARLAFSNINCGSFGQGFGFPQDIYASVQKHYQSEVCVVSWIHEEVDYNVQALVFVEPKDHLKRLHLRGQVWRLPSKVGFVGSTVHHTPTWPDSRISRGGNGRNASSPRSFCEVFIWFQSLLQYDVWFVLPEQIVDWPDLVYIGIRPIVRGIQNVKTIFNLLEAGEQRTSSSLASKGQMILCISSSIRFERQMI